MSKLNIVFFGSGDLGLEVLKKLNEKFNIKAVVTQPEKQAGRNKTLTKTPIHNLADKLRLKVLTPDNLNDQSFYSSLITYPSDLFVVVSFGKIIPQEILNLPKFGTINIHPSLLPKYRGASPIQSAILNGDKSTGISIMLLDAQMDHGPIIYTKEFSLSEKDTHESLSNKFSLEASKILPQVLEDFIKGNLKPISQNDALATYCKEIKKDMGYFDLPAGRQVSPEELQKLARMIRAYYPWPNVWTRWNGKIIKFFPEGFIQMEGKQKIKLKDFLNGYPDFPLKEI